MTTRAALVRTSFLLFLAIAIGLSASELTAVRGGSGGRANETSNGALGYLEAPAESWVMPDHPGWPLVWGGRYLDQAQEVGVDGQGNVYVAGAVAVTPDVPHSLTWTGSTDDGRTDVFLCKFNSEGLHQWTRAWGGLGYDSAYGLAVDREGNSYVTGDFEYTVDFDPGPGIQEHTAKAGETYGYDAFLSKFDSSGEFQWVRTWGGSTSDNGVGVAVDGAGNVYVAGESWSPDVDFDPGPGVEGFSPVWRGGCGFVNKFEPNGSYQWTRAWGPTVERGSVGCTGVASLPSGDIFVTGWFSWKADFDPGPEVEERTEIRNDFRDGFLVRYDTNGEFQWVRTWGGERLDDPRAISVDGSGNVYVAGQFMGICDFDPGEGVEEFGSADAWGNFVSKFSSDGGFLWARAWANRQNAGWGNMVAADASGNVYVTSYFDDVVDFDPGPGIDERTSNGRYDAFLSKFNSEGEFEWVRTWGAPDPAKCAGNGVATDAQGNVYVAGDFVFRITFAPEPERDVIAAVGNYDCFLIKLLPNGTWF